jgi:glycosyltransferase involved in cell wall biosynthesis
MKVAFCTRSDYLAVRGGDTVQLLATREKLQEDYRVEVDIFDRPESLNAGRYDICHLFNIQRIDETKAYLKRCRTAGTRVALSTVLWDFSAVVTYNFMVKRLALHSLTPGRLRLVRGCLKLLARLAGMPTIFTPAYRDYLQQTLEAADLLLPNSTEEAEQLVRLSGLSRDILLNKSMPVVNAVASHENDHDGGSEKVWLPSGCILQVGRVEPGKNQQSVIQALMDNHDIPLVFVGNQRVSPVYFRKTEALGRRRGNVLFIDEVSHEELPHLYRQALVHVLPSLGETTGLVSLEALSNGCRAVVADRRYCPYDSYFAGVTTAVDPLDVRSIRQGILDELAAKRDMSAIGQMVRTRFNWDEAARQTVEAYRVTVKA